MLPVPVLAEPQRSDDPQGTMLTGCGEARESNTRRTVPDAGKERTLAAGNLL